MFLNETWTCAWNSMWWQMSLLLLVCFNNKCLLFFVRLFTITTPNKMKWNILSLFRMMMKCSEWATVTHHREVLVHSSSKIVQPNEKCFIKQDVRAFFIRSVYKYINIYIHYEKAVIFAVGMLWNLNTPHCVYFRLRWYGHHFVDFIKVVKVWEPVIVYFRLMYNISLFHRDCSYRVHCQHNSHTNTQLGFMSITMLTKCPNMFRTNRR